MPPLSPSAPSHILIVPRPRLPWASTLCDAARRVFHVSQVPLCPGPLLPLVVFPSTLSSSPPSNSLRYSLHSSSFCPHLQAADGIRNADKPRHLRVVCPARPLAPVAICVLLAYSNTLLPSLQRSTASKQDEIDALTATKQHSMRGMHYGHSPQNADIHESATSRAVAMIYGAAEVGSDDGGGGTGWEVSQFWRGMARWRTLRKTPCALWMGA